MPDRVRKVSDFSIDVANRPGEAFRVFSALVSAGISLLACSGTSKGRRSRIVVTPDDTVRFKAAARKAGLAFTSRRTGFLIQGEDREGALAEHLKKLADAQINVTAIDAVAGGSGRFGAIVWVEPDAVAKAARRLDATAGRAR
jgi:hypothetical protein